MSTINMGNVERHLNNLENGLYLSFNEIIEQMQSYESENDTNGLNEFFIAYVVHSFFDSEQDSVDYDIIVNCLVTYQLCVFMDYSFNKTIRIDKEFEQIFFNFISNKLYKLVETDRNGDEFISFIKDEKKAINEAFSRWCFLTSNEKINQKIEVFKNDNLIIEFSLNRYLTNLEVLICDMDYLNKIDLDQYEIYSGKYLIDHSELLIIQDISDIEKNKVYYLCGLYYEFISDKDLEFVETLDIFKRGVYDN